MSTPPGPFGPVEPKGITQLLAYLGEPSNGTPERDWTGLAPIDPNKIINVLREIDRRTTKGAHFGDAECVWYYERGTIEDALGVPRGTLDTGDYREGEDDE